MGMPPKIVPYPGDVAKRLIKTQPRLSPFLFDKNGNMHEEIRQVLLEKSNFFINLTLKGIPGLEVEDIQLSGSGATYLYHENSDIDIRVIVKNSGNPLLPKNGRYLSEFLHSLSGELRFSNFMMFVDKIYVDIKIECVEIDWLGLFSIQDNKWLIQPKKNILTGITAEELMAMYYEECDEINLFKQKFEKIDGKYKIEDCYCLLEFYRAIVHDKTYRKLKNYMVYKIMNSQMKIKNFGSEVIQNFCETLSQKESDHGE